MVAVEVKAHQLSVRFLMHPMHNPKKSKEAGRPIYDEIEGCEIWVPGVKTVGGNVFPAFDMYEATTDPITGDRIETTYAQKFNREYLAFKDGNGAGGSGTPLEELPFLTAAKRLELKALHIVSAEQLAGLDGSPLKQLGMGGRELKDQAAAYMETAGRNRDATYLRDELAKRDAEMAQMKIEFAALKTGTATVAPAVDLAATEDAFKDFNEDDLRNWLTEAGVEPDGRWGRQRLLTEAKVILDRDGKKKAA